MVIAIPHQSFLNVKGGNIEKNKFFHNVSYHSFISLE